MIVQQDGALLTVFLEQFNDLPDIEAAAEHVGTAWLRAAESDPWIQPLSGRFVGELLDHLAAGAAGPFRLLADEQLDRLTQAHTDRLALHVLILLQILRRSEMPTVCPTS